jgi:hypothetical protein
MGRQRRRDGRSATFNRHIRISSYFIRIFCWFLEYKLKNSTNGAVYTTMISTEWRPKLIQTYQHLLCTGVALHASTFPRSSSGGSQEYQTKFLNWVTLIRIHILQFDFVFDSEYTFVTCNLTMHTKTPVMYGFHLSLNCWKMTQNFFSSMETKRGEVTKWEIVFWNIRVCSYSFLQQAYCPTWNISEKECFCVKPEK